MTVISVDFFMNLPHEAVTKWLQNAALAIVSSLTLFELVMGKGSKCEVNLARLLLETRVGISLDLETPFQQARSGIPWVRISTTLALICYVISVLIEHKQSMKNFSFSKIRQLSCNLLTRTAQVGQDPEQGQDHAAARVDTIGPASSLVSSPSPPLTSNPAVPTVFVVGMPKVIQVAPYQASPSRAISPSDQKVTSLQQRKGSRGEASQVCETLPYTQDHPVPTENPEPTFVLHPNNLEGRAQGQAQSNRDTSWKVTFLFGILASIICLIVTITDMKNGVAVGGFVRVNILANYCLPFYWVMVVEECYLVSRRIVRTWLADYWSSYFV